MAIAEGQQANSLRLRAATSLADLWGRQGRTNAAAELLDEVVGSFDEGFDTPDLRDAQMLLEALPRSVLTSSGIRVSHE